jgi:hypothetical protein
VNYYIHVENPLFGSTIKLLDFGNHRVGTSLNWHFNLDSDKIDELYKLAAQEFEGI